MSLTKMLGLAGIGCGDSCGCAKAFVASLDEGQRELLGHMITKGAKLRHEALQEAEGHSADADDRSGGLTLANFLDQMFSGDFSEVPDVEPYSSELTEEQLGVIAALPEEVRSMLEIEVRKLIAGRADNDPERVTIESDGLSLSVKIKKADKSQNETRRRPVDEREEAVV